MIWDFGSTINILNIERISNEGTSAREPLKPVE